MPQFNIVKRVEVENTPRVTQLLGLFDIPPSERSESEWKIDLPIDGTDWKIGLIVGPSGSGKSTFAREAFGEGKYVFSNQGYDWPKTKSIVDGFDKGNGIKQITGALSSVGFSSPPAWVRPFDTLSTGEQFRATMARAILDPSPLVVIDEFTSVIDRTVAQIGSAAISKAIRKTPKKQIVAVTCHHDVTEWLCPDWVLEMPSGTFTRGLLRRPPIELEIKRVHSSAWQFFKRHHYLSAELNKTAICFVAFYQGRPVCFSSTMHFCHPKASSFREHRTVVFPDYQGVGIGNAVSEYVASLMSATGKPFSSVTQAPAMVAHRAKSPKWSVGRKMGFVRYGVHSGKPSLNKNVSCNRFTATFRYIGESNPEDAHRFGINNVGGKPGAKPKPGVRLTGDPKP